MTELEALRASEAKYRAIFDLANDAIFLHDAQTGAILEVNQKMTEMYGYSRDEALRLTVADLSAHEPPYTQERAMSLLREALQGTAQLFEWRGRHRDGRVFWVEVNLKHVVMEGADRLLAIVRDIGDRKRAEESLHAADEQLREQASLVRLGEMAAVVAHEVKNPLAGIRGTIQILATRMAPGSKDALIAAEMIARIDALNDLMKDILLFARPPRPHPAPVDVLTLVRETSELIAQDGSVHAVTFEVEGAAPRIQADPELLRIVLTNLMLNAAQAMPRAGTVRTRIAADDAFCRIAVVDSGPGIPDDIRERIFTPFFTTKSRGTGLGLPTAKRLVDAHRGRIMVECPAHGGTIVTVELPR